MHNLYWEELYHLYGKQLYIFLNQLSRDPNMAEDLLQETFLAAIQNKPENIKNERAWLYKIAYHLFLKQKKKNKQWFFLPEDMELEARDNTQEKIDYRILHEQILVYLEHKKKRLAIVFFLRTEYDFKIREIAPILKVSEKSVKRDLEKIRKLIAPFLN